MKSEIFDKLKAVGFIPEYAVNSCDDAVFLASSLTKGNLPVLTLKGEGAFEAFDAIRKAEILYFKRFIHVPFPTSSTRK